MCNISENKYFNMIFNLKICIKKKFELIWNSQEPKKIFQWQKQIWNKRNVVYQIILNHSLYPSSQIFLKNVDIYMIRRLLGTKISLYDPLFNCLIIFYLFGFLILIRVSVFFFYLISSIGVKFLPQRDNQKIFNKNNFIFVAQKVHVWAKKGSQRTLFVFLTFPYLCIIWKKKTIQKTSGDY